MDETKSPEEDPNILNNFCEEKQKNVANEIQQATEALRNVLDVALTSVEEDDDFPKFVEDDVRKLGQAINIYHTLFSNLGVKTRQELEELWKPLKNDSDELQGFIDDLLQVEEQWDKFLETVDDSLKGDFDSNQLDSINFNQCQDVSLYNIQTNESITLSEALGKGPILLLLLQHFACLPWRDHITQLQKRLDEFREYGTEVYIITFGCIEGATKWKQEVGCDLDILIDADRQVYAAFKLGSSLSKVWNNKTMIYYAEQLCLGRTLPKPFENIEDDIHQMGGDFILDSSGNVVLAYRNKIAPDRPPVDLLLEKIKELQG